MCIRTFLTVLTWAAMVLADEGGGQDVDNHSGEGTHEEVEEYEPVVALLFPWFIAVIGVMVYYVLSRTTPWLPYTAVMFVIGTGTLRTTAPKTTETS